MVPMEGADFEAAARLSVGRLPPLRAGDALQLAACQRARSSLATMERDLAAAGLEAGLAVELIQV
jgi:predicted nucleic acid-binding protein